MAYTTTVSDPRALAFTQTKVAPKGAPKAAAKTAPKRGVFTRLMDAMMMARQRQAEREVARYLADTGGKFTDEAEREIERRFLSPQARW
jgi:hypothetical protein